MADQRGRHRPRAGHLPGAGIEPFHHISTAYVCGTRTDPVGEDEPLPAGGFRNDYEASKAAEGLVRAAGFADPVTVFRPAVIVGDSRTGFTSTYHGLYLYLQFLWAMSRRAARGPDGSWRLPLRLDLTGAERRNLVPVDWVAAVIADVVAAPALHGRTYHLGPDRAVTARELEDAMAEYFGYSGITFVGPGGSADPRTPTEARFYQYVARYAPYWAAEPGSDTAHTRTAVPHRPRPPLDAGLPRRLIDFAARDAWGRRPTAVPETAASRVPPLQ